MISQKLKNLADTLAAYARTDTPLDRGDIQKISSTLESLALEARQIENTPISADLRMEIRDGEAKVVALSAWRKTPHQAVVPFPGGAA